MKFLRRVFVFALFGLFSISCVSMQDREISVQDLANVQMVGQATVDFSSWQFLHIPNKKGIMNKAYLELKKIAQEGYGSNADIVNIVITGGWSWWQLLNIFSVSPIAVVGLGLFIANVGASDLSTLGAGIAVTSVLFGGNTQKITATGDIILLQ